MPYPTPITDRIHATFPEIMDDFVKHGLKKALEIHALNLSEFHRIVTLSPELSENYGLARENHADYIVSEILEIADDNEKDPQRARNQIDARKWIAGKLVPRTYGDKLDVNINQTVDIRSALSEAHNRTRQVIDIPRQSLNSPTDSQSVAVPRLVPPTSELDDILS